MGGLTRGIAATGNYPGKSRTPDELRQDLNKAMSLIPARQNVNVHAIYSERGSDKADTDILESKHFKNWVDWAKSQKTGLNFNPSYFSHTKSGDGMAKVKDIVYTPNPQNVKVYDKLYAGYKILHDYFGRGSNDVMKRLKKIKESV